MQPEIEKTKLNDYFQARVEQLRDLVIANAERVFSEKTEQHDRKFEEAIEGRLRNGAKFVPRKRQPR